MEGQVVLFGALSAVLAISSVAGRIRLALIAAKLGETTGTVADVQQPAAKTMRVTNSKWATFRYEADGKTYTSANRMQVPMNAKAGDRFPIRYYRERPTVIAAFSEKSSERPTKILLAAAVVCFAIAWAVRVV